jgi:hypothetical protein
LICNFNDKNFFEIITHYCFPEGKIKNQILMKQLGFSIPDSILIFNYNNQDINKINFFIKDKESEYQIRTENIGNKLRYSETATGLLKSGVLNEIGRIKRSRQILLLQRLPKNALQRDLYSLQYFIYDHKLIIEVRAGIATHLARCGWSPSEVLEIPLNRLKSISIKDIGQYRSIGSKEVLKENIYLDCSDAGLFYLKNRKNIRNILKLPINAELKRIKKIYEFTQYELNQSLKKYILTSKGFDIFWKNYNKKSKVMQKWFKLFTIPPDFKKMTFQQFLSTIGFVQKYYEKDKLDSLRNRLLDLIIKNNYYKPITHELLKKVFGDVKSCLKILTGKAAKLSIISNEKGTILLYWDLIKCR